MTQNLIQWNNLFNDVPCFIIGTSPSLIQSDLTLLEDYLTIGINKVCYIFDPVILMWQDRNVYVENKKQILQTQSIKLCRESSFEDEPFKKFILTENEFKMPENTSILHGTGSTGPLAFQLAYLMGCNPIILLGMDGKYSKHQTNFWGQNWMHPPTATEKFTQGLKWIKNYENEKSIFNCSDNNIFEKKYTLKESIEIINPNPLGQNFFKSKSL